MQKRNLQPDALFALKFLHEAKLSPDLSRVACVVSRTPAGVSEELFEITVRDVASRAERTLPYSGRATSPRWSPDGATLAFVGATAESSRIILYDLATENVSTLTPEQQVVHGPPAWAPDGARLAYAVVQKTADRLQLRVTKRVYRADELGATDGLGISLHLLDLESRSSRSLEVGLAVAVQPAFSPCGQEILFLGSDAAAGYPPLDLKAYVLNLASGTVVQITDDRWYVAAAAWSSCGDSIVIAGDRDSPLAVPTARLWVIDRHGSNAECRSDAATSCLGVHAHHDMPTWRSSQNAFFCVANDKDAYATVTEGGCAQIYRISLRGPVSCEALTSRPRTCVIFDIAEGASQLLYGATDLHKPWDLLSLDLKTRSETSLTRLNEAVLDGWPKLKVDHLEFRSGDGLPLEGWFMTRADSGGPQPTVLFIHGGPELVTGHAFRFDFHLLAANGYAVLFSNFRGSSGYGPAFRQALRGDWGALGFPDHMATVDAAVASDQADPQRLGIWGPSHGGYATAWVICHTNRFRAAVAESAVVNLTTLYYLSDLPDVFARELGGRPDEIPHVYQARSPLTYARHCRTPTLLLHGTDDLRCPIAEAEQFYRALHDAGCATELARIAGMTHMGDSVGPLSARVGQNEELLEWFERHL